LFQPEGEQYPIHGKFIFAPGEEPNELREEGCPSKVVEEEEVASPLPGDDWQREHPTLCVWCWGGGYGAVLAKEGVHYLPCSICDGTGTAALPWGELR
jgi:hypothetical protein